MKKSLKSLALSPLETQVIRPKSWIKSANVDRYFCSVCGYSEEWIAKAKDLSDLSKKYGKIEDLDEFV